MDTDLSQFDNYSERQIEFSLAHLQYEEQLQERDAVTLWRPSEGEQEAAVYDICERGAKRLVLRGGNRAGKTLESFIILSSAITKNPLHYSDGTTAPYPFPERPLKVCVVGWDWRHIGHTVFDRLFTPGAFHRFRALPIWTEHQRLEQKARRKQGNRVLAPQQKPQGWRVWQPFNEEDKDLEPETYPHEALIPGRLYDIKDWAWENKKENQFKIAKTKYGDEIYTYPSTAEAPQGVIFDFVLIDEDVSNSKALAELLTRTADSGGWMVWSAWPHSKNKQLRILSTQARAQKTQKNPRVVERRLQFSLNIYLDEQTKKNTIADWKMFGGDEVRARDKGEYIDDVLSMYPQFNEDVHCLRMLDSRPNEDHAIIKHVADILRRRDGQPPENWRRDLALDPGSVICAVLFGCVPDPDDFLDKNGKPIPGCEEMQWRQFRIVYDELYLHRMGPLESAPYIAQKVRGHTFQKFLIDYRGSRVTSVGAEQGNTVRSLYQAAFAGEMLVCAETDDEFEYGTDDLAAGCMVVRDGLKLRSNGTPDILIVEENCPNLVSEIDNYKKRITNDEAQDKPAEGQKDHACDCLRYWYCSDPQWIKPEAPEAPEPNVYKAFKKFMEQQNPQRDPHRGSIRCGSPINRS